MALHWIKIFFFPFLKFLWQRPGNVILLWPRSEIRIWKPHTQTDETEELYLTIHSPVTLIGTPWQHGQKLHLMFSHPSAEKCDFSDFDYGLFFFKCQMGWIENLKLLIFTHYCLYSLYRIGLKTKNIQWAAGGGRKCLVEREYPHSFKLTGGYDNSEKRRVYSSIWEMS